MEGKTRFIKDCNKIGYLTKSEADSNKRNQRSYLCFNCNLFHCTSSKDGIRKADKNRAKQMESQMKEFDEKERLRQDVLEKFRL